MGLNPTILRQAQPSRSSSALAALPRRSPPLPRERFSPRADSTPSPTTPVRPLPGAFLPFGESSLSARSSRSAGARLGVLTRAQRLVCRLCPYATRSGCQAGNRSRQRHARPSSRKPAGSALSARGRAEHGRPRPRPLPGHIGGWRTYGGDRFETARKVRLWCSEKDDHAGGVGSRVGKERMEFYPDQLRPDIRDAIFARSRGGRPAEP